MRAILASPPISPAPAPPSVRPPPPASAGSGRTTETPSPSAPARSRRATRQTINARPRSCRAPTTAPPPPPPAPNRTASGADTPISNPPQTPPATATPRPAPSLSETPRNGAHCPTHTGAPPSRFDFLPFAHRPHPLAIVVSPLADRRRLQVLPFVAHYATHHPLFPPLASATQRSGHPGTAPIRCPRVPTARPSLTPSSAKNPPRAAPRPPASPCPTPWKTHIRPHPTSAVAPPSFPAPIRRASPGVNHPSKGSCSGASPGPVPCSRPTNFPNPIGEASPASLNACVPFAACAVASASFTAGAPRATGSGFNRGRGTSRTSSADASFGDHVSRSRGK